MQMFSPFVLVWLNLVIEHGEESRCEMGIQNEEPVDSQKDTTGRGTPHVGIISKRAVIEQLRACT